MKYKKYLRKIDTLQGFKNWINEIIDQTEYLLNNEEVNSKIILKSNEELQNHYLNKRNEIIKNVSPETKIFKIEFVNNRVRINDNDFNEIIDFTKTHYDKKKQLKVVEKIDFPTIEDKKKFLKKIDKEYSEYYDNRLTEIQNSIWIAFYNLKIQELQQPIKIDNSNQSKPEDLPDWFPIGLGFAIGKIQKELLKDISFSKIAINYTGKRSNANYVSFTKSNLKKDVKNIYSDFDKLKIVYNHCINNNIEMCNDFKDAYSKKLKDIS